MKKLTIQNKILFVVGFLIVIFALGSVIKFTIDNRKSNIAYPAMKFDFNNLTHNELTIYKVDWGKKQDEFIQTKGYVHSLKRYEDGYLKIYIRWAGKKYYNITDLTNVTEVHWLSTNNQWTMLDWNFRVESQREGKPMNLFKQIYLNVTNDYKNMVITKREQKFGEKKTRTKILKYPIQGRYYNVMHFFTFMSISGEVMDLDSKDSFYLITPIIPIVVLTSPTQKKFEIIEIKGKQYKTAIYSFKINQDFNGNILNSITKQIFYYIDVETGKLIKYKAQMIDETWLLEEIVQL
jgi:hypothetical protein